ncbi:MAG: lipoprotein [Bacteroidales bacterium]|nr:lipoprotein [Bacteroidales bacterium]
MKRIAFIFVALAVLTVSGCKKPVFTYIHDKVDITSITVTNLGEPVFASVSGQINQETGEILFPIPRVDADKFDINHMKAYASIPLDARIEPPLAGIHDFEKDYPIKVISMQTGNSREYVLKVYFSRY